MKSWTDHSAEWLQEQIKTHPEMSKEELRKWCSKNYPYVRPVRHGKTEPSAQELEKLGQKRLID